ncbi:MAG: tetratricopeptide repeat protein [Steroidobacteraceae bacterium]
MNRGRDITACLSLLLVVAALAAAPADAQRSRKPQTIGDLERRQIDVRPEARVPGSAARAMENYRKYLELQNADPATRAEALRRLGDLNLEAGELERMEQEVSAIDLAGAEAIKLYTMLLKAYPNYPRNDQVLYQLARAFETTGQPEQALATLDRIVREYPTVPQLSEVDFRRGEILFSAKRYAEAQSAYQRSLAAGETGPFYEQSLYKLGWSLFKQSLNEESLGPFTDVLDANLVDRRDPGRVLAIDSLKRADRELVEDTLRVLSITFSYLDGADSLSAFLDTREPAPRYAYLMYARLGDLYVEKQRYQDAANAYRAFVARDPNNDNAPLLAMQAIEAYRKGDFAQLVLDGKREYIERYNFASAFWQGRDRAKLPQVVAELKTNIKDVATYYHATAQTSKKIDDYAVAARWYRDYLASFPDDPDSAATNYLLGETLYESRQYADAASEYEKTAYGYPKNERSAAAGYASLVAFQKERERLSGEAQAAWHLRQIDAGIKFAATFPEHPDSGGVITRAAQDVFALQDLPRAIDVAQRVLAHQPAVDVPKQRIAWNIIGEANFQLGVYDQAEAGYLRARDLVPANDPLRKDLTERLAASVYRQAEAKRSAGDGLAAVEDFLRVAAVAPDSGIRATAEYDAAAQLVLLKEWGRAITVFENYRRSYPKDPRQPEVTRNLAVAYAEANRPADAAVEFERIAETTTEDPALRREALQSAADLFDKAGNVPKTRATLERFVQRYPTPVPEAIETRQRLADIAGRSGDAAAQLNWYREIVKADAAAGAARRDRTRLLAARAQLALAAPPRDAFRAIRLVAPLKRSLEQKRKALDLALQAYRAAVDYRVADVTTAASFEMAELYRVLGADLLKSERPKGLGAEAQEQYDLLLEEQAFPFEEQAISLHEINAARAREGLYDEWVERSFAALAGLKPARYGKTEMVQDVVTSLE